MGVIGAGSAAVRRSGAVMLRFAGLFAERFDPLNHQIRLWQSAKIIRQLLVDEGQMALCRIDIVLSALVVL